MVGNQFTKVVSQGAKTRKGYLPHLKTFRQREFVKPIKSAEKGVVKSGQKVKRFNSNFSKTYKKVGKSENKDFNLSKDYSANIQLKPNNSTFKAAAEVNKARDGINEYARFVKPRARKIDELLQSMVGDVSKMQDAFLFALQQIDAIEEMARIISDEISGVAQARRAAQECLMRLTASCADIALAIQEIEDKQKGPAEKKLDEKKKEIEEIEKEISKFQSDIKEFKQAETTYKFLLRKCEEMLSGGGEVSEMEKNVVEAIERLERAEQEMEDITEKLKFADDKIKILKKESENNNKVIQYVEVQV